MESKKFKLNKEDLVKIGKGLGIAMGGAGLTYVITTIPNVDFGAYTPVVVALASVLINAARKWLAENAN